MNQEQVKAAVRWIIATFGPFIISHGYATSSTLELFGGVLVSLIPFIWGLLTHTDTNAVAVASAVSAVKAITVSDPAMADAAKAADPSTNVTVKS